MLFYGHKSSVFVLKNENLCYGEDMVLEEWKNKKILILGFGKEGQDTYKFLRKLFSNKAIGIADKNEFLISNSQFLNLKKDKGIKWHLGKDYLKALKNYDVIIKSPGIPFKILPKESLKKITTQTKIFFDYCQGKIIGVTATKGKSTTASLIYKILKKGGIKVHLVGNIGKPVLSTLLKTKTDDIFVYELSSHQLYNLKKSPYIAVLLNIYPEHLDYYRNFKEYAKAKANITKYQTKNDFLIYNKENELVKKIAKASMAKKISIQGKYYQLDRNAAKKVGEIFRISKNDIEEAIHDFKGLPHRLEYVGTFKGITFYNDALSTIPETTMAALDFLGNKVETIFLGGFDRGLNFKNLEKRILESKIKNLILFPPSGDRIWRELSSFKKKREFKAVLVQNMRDGVRKAYQYTQKGKICLLSTASPSFGIFRDYKEKGNLFKKYVKQFAK